MAWCLLGSTHTRANPPVAQIGAADVLVVELPANPKQPKRWAMDSEPDGREGRAASYWKTAGLATVLVAVLGLVGIVIESRSGNGPSSSADPTSQQPPTSTTTGPSNSGTTETTVPPSTTSTTLGPVRVFRETDGAPVVVASCIDLDSQEPDWGVGSRSHKDLCVSFGALGAATVKATRLAVVHTRPRFRDCEKQTVLRPSTTTAETVPGQHLCVRSSDKRWAHVRIAAIDRSASTMSFDIVVWKLPSDP
jgi:hypothetical protein